MKRLKSLAFWILALLAASFLGTFLVSAAEIYSYAMKDLPDASAEYAIVLGAKTLGPRPRPAFEGRIAHAIELYRRRKVLKLIFTGGPGEPAQALVARAYALGSGVPAPDILVETKSLRTFENLQEAKALIPDPATATVLIVSDAFHLKRALLMAEDLGLKALPAPVPRSNSRGDRLKLRFVLRESLALMKYRCLRQLAKATRLSSFLAR